jgi:tetratricopeptide (TPR) repeat protein
MPEPDVRTPTPFVGREPELSQLHQVLQTVVNSKNPLFLLVQGDYGVGKTELVNHFLTEASLLNSQILIGRGNCGIENELSGLTPFRQLFSSLTDQDTNPHLALNNLLRFAVEVAPAWLDIPTAGAASAAIKTVEAGQKLVRGSTFSLENVYVQFTNALSRLAEKHPIIAFIDDLHWADASSLGLLFHLARNLQDRAVLFVMTYRPVEAMESSTNAALFRTIRANLIRFGAVELEIKLGISVASYVNQRYPLNAFPSDLLGRVEAQTGGHALFVSQVFSLWEEKRTIAAAPTARGWAEWRVVDDASTDLAVPQKLGEILAERIRSMADELREALVCASVEGDDFTVQTIARLRHLDEVEACDNLELLDHHYYLVQENGTKQIGPNVLDFYRFAHRFFREHIYIQLHPLKKRALHKHVGECLEALYTDRSEIAGQLARHFREALDWMKSAQYALMAARFEQSRYAWEEGERWCEKGLELVDKLPANTETAQLQMSLLEQSGYGHNITGRYSIADKKYRKALILAQQLGDAVRTAQLCNKLNNVCCNEGQYDEAVRLLDQARQILIDGAISLGELHIEIESNWAFTQARLGKHDLAVATLGKALSDAQTLPQTLALDSVKREIYVSLGVVLNDLNRYEESIAAYQEGIKIDEKLGLENRLVSDLISLADTYMRMGELNQSMINAVRGEEIARRVGDLDGIAFAKTGKGDTLLALANPRDAIRELTEAIAVMEQIGALWYISHTLATLALAYRAVSDLDTAYQKAVCGLEYAERTKYQFELGYALDALAQVEAARQEWEPARLHFAQAIAAYQESSSRHYAGRSQSHFAEMLIAQGNREDAVRLLKAAMEVFQELGLSREVTKTRELLTAAA